MMAIKDTQNEPLRSILLGASCVYIFVIHVYKALQTRKCVSSLFMRKAEILTNNNSEPAGLVPCIVRM